MDTEFLKDIQKHQHLFMEDQNAQDVHYIACPKCESTEVENDRCGSCGFDLSFNPLGEPLGEKSFYTFREKYWQTLSELEMENPKIFQGDVKFKKFMIKVRRRYNNLLDYFYSDESKGDKLRPLYLQELTDIVVEMMNSGVSEKEIWRSYTEKGIDESTLYERMKEAISNTRIEAQNNPVENFFNYKMMGFLKVSNLLYVLMFVVIFLGVTLALTSYLRAI